MAGKIKYEIIYGGDYNGRLRYRHNGRIYATYLNALQMHIAFVNSRLFRYFLPDIIASHQARSTTQPES